MAGSKRAPAAKADPEPAAAEEAAPAGESPVISAVSKRLRNLRKKLKNVEALEALQRDNKELNPEQARGAPARARALSRRQRAAFAARHGPARPMQHRADACAARSCLLSRRRAP